MGDTITFQPVIKDPLSFNSAYKVLQQEGNLVYEYNPFRNYRLSKQAFEYQNHIYTLSDFIFSIFFIKNKEVVDEVSEEVTNLPLNILNT